MKDVVKFEKSTAQFGRYFSPAIREKIQESEFDLLDNENNTQMVAVLFTDIDGFTKLSESMSSKEIIEMLSEYQDRMIKPIFKNSGTVDKFIGDSVMATFGTPVSQGNDAQNAFNCAREMQIAMRQWVKEREDRKLPVVTHRIGIHFGSCVVGNIGNEDRKEFTVVGDVVNVANRVCDICKELKCDFLVTESLKNRLNETLNAESVENYTIRGRKDKITLFKVQT
jgi:adenylate cyclase